VRRVDAAPDLTDVERLRHVRLLPEPRR
jgi:hypothetical protein